jgi:Chitin recognition protein.
MWMENKGRRRVTGFSSSLPSFPVIWVKRNCTPFFPTDWRLLRRCSKYFNNKGHIGFCSSVPHWHHLRVELGQQLQCECFCQRFLLLQVAGFPKAINSTIAMGSATTQHNCQSLLHRPSCQRTRLRLCGLSTRLIQRASPSSRTWPSSGNCLSIQGRIDNLDSDSGSLRKQDLPTGTCAPGVPCTNGACCSNTGVCSYAPSSCGADVCISNCDAKAPCGEYANPDNATCPLNVCCSQYGFCKSYYFKFAGAFHILRRPKNTYLCANLIFQIAPQHRGLQLSF